MKKIQILLLLCLVASGVEATTLTLDSCLCLARKNNADIAISQLKIERAREVKKQVFTKYFPQVQANFFAYHAYRHLISLSPEAVIQSGDQDMGALLQGLIDIYNGMHDTDWDELGIMNHGLSVGAQLVQPIYAGGRIVNGNKLAKVGVEAAKLQEEVTERDILEDVESSFYLVAGLEEKTQTLQSALLLIDSIDHTAQVAYEAGLVTKADILTVALKRNELSAKEQQLSSGIVLAKKMLCQQIGIPYSDSLHFSINGQEQSILAHGQRPEQQLLRLNIRAEQLRKKLTLGESLPQVAFGAMAFYGDAITNGNIFKMPIYKYNGLLFATVQVPITSWWETSHKLKEHNTRIREAELTQRKFAQLMSIQEEKAYSDWKQTEALLRSDSSALEMAEENHRLALLNYEAGTQTLNDVLQAHMLLLQAENALTDRRISYLEARRRYMDLTSNQ